MVQSHHESDYGARKSRTHAEGQSSLKWSLTVTASRGVPFFLEDRLAVRVCTSRDPIRSPVKEGRGAATEDHPREFSILPQVLSPTPPVVGVHRLWSPCDDGSPTTFTPSSRPSVQEGAAECGSGAAATAAAVVISGSHSMPDARTSGA